MSVTFQDKSFIPPKAPPERKAGQVEIQWRNKKDDFYKTLDHHWHHYAFKSRDEAGAFLANQQSPHFEYRIRPRDK